MDEDDDDDPDGCQVLYVPIRVYIMWLGLEMRDFRVVARHAKTGTNRSSRLKV